jgi:hypothetical protein
MRAIILFDGSRNSQLSLQAACHDAYRQWHAAQDQPSLPVEALVITFEALTTANMVNSDPFQSKTHSHLLLEQAINNLEACGEFDKIIGEMIRCSQTELTEVLIDRAKEWKADSIYLPLKSKQPILATSVKPPKVGWLHRLGLRTRPQPEAQIFESDPRETLSTSQIEITKLMEQAQCRIALTDNEGITMKLHYVAPASSTAFKAAESKKTIGVA